MKAERRLQLRFRKGNFFGSLTLALPIFAAANWHAGQPSRWPAPYHVVVGRAAPVTVHPRIQAWRLSAPDPRFGGLSALALEQGELIALTDSGVTIRFVPPGLSENLRIVLRDLPAGPGSPFRKSGSDSESLLADRDSRGWWIGFENRHSLWLFSRDLNHVLARKTLEVEWHRNYGSEALVQGTTGVMALPEGGGAAAGGDLVAPAWTSDATRLRDGRLVLLIRRPRLTGFDNQVWIARGASKPARRITLDLGTLDNMEGIAAAPLPDGGTRLWMVSDNDFRPWRRTLLVALDLGPSV